MTRFQPGDVVVHRDEPSRPLVVIRTAGPLVFVSGGRLVSYAHQKLHGTGMRQVLPKSRSQMRYGR